MCVGARKRTVNFCACLRCRTFIFYTWGIHCGPSQRHTCLAFHSPKCEEHLCTEWYKHAVTHQFKFKVKTHTIIHSALLCLLCRSKPNNYFINGKTKTETVFVCSNRKHIKCQRNFRVYVTAGDKQAKVTEIQIQKPQKQGIEPTGWGASMCTYSLHALRTHIAQYSGEQQLSSLFVEHMLSKMTRERHRCALCTRTTVRYSRCVPFCPHRGCAGVYTFHNRNGTSKIAF